MVSWEITVARQKKNLGWFFISFWRLVLSLLHYLPMEFRFAKNEPSAMYIIVITLCNDTSPSRRFFFIFIIRTLSEIEYTTPSQRKDGVGFCEKLSDREIIPGHVRESQVFLLSRCHTYSYNYIIKELGRKYQQ